MLLCLIILMYLTLALASPTGRIEVTYPSLETSRSGIKIVKLRVFGQDIVLNLEPAGDVISDNFTIMDEDGKTEPIDAKSFKGKLFMDSTKDAALYINENGFIEIEGIINSKLRIEPSVSHKVTKYGMKEHVITEALDEKKRFRDSVNLNFQRSFSKDKARNFTEDQCVEIEYYFLAEKNLTEGFSDVNKFIAFLGTVLVQARTMLDTLNLKIKIRALGLRILKTITAFITSSLFPGTDIFNVDDIMTNMQIYVCANKDYFKKADIILLFTEKEIGFLDSKGNILFGILGAANFGQACNKCNKVAVIKANDDVRDTAITVAHESAHLLGSPHDGESANSKNCPADEGFLMGDNSGANKEKFSTCSLENIKYFLSKTEARCVIKDCENTV
uniref:TSA: Tityus bahiensis Tbah00842 mRNA sequence n=1 Tax=Tityus bahiensis TaxID=50343 RepID=A0A0C9RFP2_TITBA